MKTCSKCKQIKNFTDFHKNASRKDGFAHQCKICASSTNKNYKTRHAKELQLKLSKYRATKFFKKKRAAQIKKRRRSDLQFKLSHALRRRLRSAIKRNQKAGSAVKDLGCSIEFLKSYLESRFQCGMTWNNYGKWHIDHIKPLSKFDLTDEIQFKEAVHYTNLQPLWASDNLKKGAKYE